MVGDWEIHEKLGDGGMGIVYRASHVLISGDFALKMLRPELSREPTVVNRFLAEVKKARLLDHPNIVRMELPFKANDSIYLPMELLHGNSLSELLDLEPDPWPVDRTLEIIYQSAAGLGHAHSRSVLHRDIKPENIFVTSTGRVKLLDFGLAKKLGDKSLTAEGMAVGTPVYMAPEILEGKKPIAQSDMYAIGMILFRMLTGKLPIPIQNTAASIAEIFGPVLHAHEEGLPRPSSLRPGLPIWLDELCAALISRDPEIRPSNGAELAKFLEGHRVRSDGTTSQDIPVPVRATSSGEYHFGTNSSSPEFAVTPLEASARAKSMTSLSVDSKPSYKNILVMVITLVIGIAGTLTFIRQNQSTPSPVQSASSAPSKQLIQLTSKPSGAAVFIGTRRVCKTTPCQASVATGTRQFRFELARYETAKIEQLIDAKNKVVSASLRNEFGTLSVQTTPTGLPVFVNNKRIGISPINGKEVPPGQYEVEIRSKKFRSSRLQIQIAAGDQRQLQIVGVPSTTQLKKPKYDDFFELDVSKSKGKKAKDPSFDLEP